MIEHVGRSQWTIISSSPTCYLSQDQGIKIQVLCSLQSPSGMRRLFNVRSWWLKVTNMKEKIDFSKQNWSLFISAKSVTIAIIQNWTSLRVFFIQWFANYNDVNYFAYPELNFHDLDEGLELSHNLLCTKGFFNSKAVGFRFI